MGVPGDGRWIHCEAKRSQDLPVGWLWGVRGACQEDSSIKFLSNQEQGPPFPEVGSLGLEVSRV